MKALTTPQGNFGPFQSIEVIEDRYRCDNTDLPFSVIGQGEIVEADTITWPEHPAPPVPVPQSVSRRQAKTVMELSPDPIHGDMWKAALAAAAAIADPATRVITTNYLLESLYFEHPTVLVMAGQLLDMTAAQVDALFVTAETL